MASVIWLVCVVMPPITFVPAGSGALGSRPTVTTDTSGALDIIVETTTLPLPTITVLKRTRNCGNPATGTCHAVVAGEPLRVNVLFVA